MIISEWQNSELVICFSCALHISIDRNARVKCINSSFRHELHTKIDIFFRFHFEYYFFGFLSQFNGYLFFSLGVKKKSLYWRVFQFHTFLPPLRSGPFGMKLKQKQLHTVRKMQISFLKDLRIVTKRFNLFAREVEGVDRNWKLSRLVFERASKFDMQKLFEKGHHLPWHMGKP